MMLTYTFTQTGPDFLYEQLYKYLRRDIENGRLTAGERLPSKRSFAAHLGLSLITIEKAYGQLQEEGYIYSQPKRGFFVAKRPQVHTVALQKAESPEETRPAAKDISAVSPSIHFPFATWGKILRQTLADDQAALLQPTPVSGALVLRQAIAGHLKSFRGLAVQPEQIVIGAGTEYLYSLLVRLLGTDRLFCLEEPGYPKIRQIYESHGVRCCAAPLDQQGLSVASLRQCNASVVHISPSHQFPTGRVMSMARRYEILAWANEQDGRYIIEDDYDSEISPNGRPLPTLSCMDAAGRVIYTNTFSKTLTPTLRISYMVLPAALIPVFQEKLGFLSCTVPNFEQYALAHFIDEGYFEKHLNRMGNRLRTDDISIRPLKKTTPSVSSLEREPVRHSD